MANFTIDAENTKSRLRSLVDGSSYVLQNTGDAIVYISERPTSGGEPTGGGNVIPPYVTWSLTKAANQEIWVWTAPGRTSSVEVNG